MHPVIRFNTAKDFADCAVMALKAGMDNEMPVPVAYTPENFKSKLDTGELDEILIDQAVLRMLEVKFEMGLFEHPYPIEESFGEIFAQPEYEQDSLLLAQKSIVLLKNDGILPLKNNIKKIAVIGPHASSCRALFGCYSYGALLEMIMGMTGGMVGVNDGDNTVKGEELTNAVVNTNLEVYPGTKVAKENPQLDQALRESIPGLQNLLEKLRSQHPDMEFSYAKGFDIVGTDRSDYQNAFELAKDADLTLVTVGGKYGWGSPCTSGEGSDASRINLPGLQEEFLKELAALGKPYIAVHFDGRPVSSDELDKNASAIIEAWSPGVHGAEAIESVLFGSYNPAGRLPVTVARQSGQIPIYYGHEQGTSYGSKMGEGLDGYMDETAHPRYYFGYGLSYTQFTYSELQIEKVQLNPEEELTVCVNVQNTGTVAGEEVVQMYVKDNFASCVRPVQELAGFKRIWLQPGEKGVVKFCCRLTQFAFLDDEMKWKVEAGDMTIQIGSASNDIRLTGTFTITNDAWIDGRTRGFYATSTWKPDVTNMK